MFWFLFVFLVLFVSMLDNRLVLFCACVVWFSLFENRTKWFCCLHLVVFFPFVVLFWILSIFHSSQKATQKTEQNKNPQKQNAEKNGKKKSVSAVVFTNSVPNFLGLGFKNADFSWKLYQNCGFIIFWKRKNQKMSKRLSQNWSKVESKLDPSMLRSIIGPSFDSKMVFFCLLCFFRLFENLILLAERRRLLKNKKGKIR